MCNRQNLADRQQRSVASISASGAQGTQNEYANTTGAIGSAKRKKESRWTNAKNENDPAGGGMGQRD